MNQLEKYPMCHHEKGPAWCEDCVNQMMDKLIAENERLRKRIFMLEELQSRQSKTNRIDYEDALPWHEDYR